MKVGRPLKFESVEALQAMCDMYFENTPKEEWMITGLAVHLGTSRKTLMEYEEGDGSRGEFSNTIKDAKEKITREYERRGWQNENKNQAFAIFMLKNMGLEDKQTVDQTSRNVNINTEVELNDQEQSDLKTALNGFSISEGGSSQAAKQSEDKDSAGK